MEAWNIIGGICGIGLGGLLIVSGTMEKFYRLIDRLLGLDGR